MKRSLEVELVLEKDGTVRAELRDLVSGLTKTIKNNFSPDEHPEFDAAIGNEIYSWLSLMADQMDEEDVPALESPDKEPTSVWLTLCWRNENNEIIQTHATVADWFSDWLGECELCPANDTQIISIIVDGESLHFEMGCLFEDVMEAIRPTMVVHHVDTDDEDIVYCSDPECADEPRYFIGKANAEKYIDQRALQNAKAIGCVGICKHCGQPVFPDQCPGVWAHCYHCDACYAGPEDL